jgi:hypothetical protein
MQKYFLVDMYAENHGIHLYRISWFMLLVSIDTENNCVNLLKLC